MTPWDRQKIWDGWKLVLAVTIAFLSLMGLTAWRVWLNITSAQRTCDALAGWTADVDAGLRRYGSDSPLTRVIVQADDRLLQRLDCGEYPPVRDED